MLYDVATGTLADALASPPAQLPDPAEAGEAVAFSRDGSSLWLASEGVASATWTVACEDFVADDVTRLCEESEVPTEGCGCGADGGAWLLLAPLFLLGRRRYS